jgi:hypothetical protein
LGDDYWERHIQVKTVYGKTRKWKIGRRLLRPTAQVSDLFGFEAMKSGLNGGFLLIQIDSSAGQNAEYRYADFYTLIACRDGLVGSRRFID